MNSSDLFDIIGQTPGRYILDAVNTKQTKPRTLPPKRIWLVAAILIMILCLVGCAVVYMLNLQALKVGEHNFYDEEGNLISVDGHTPITQLSLQGTNIEALTEWVEFTNNYDKDLTIAAEVDLTGSAWKEIPDNYHLTYGCYSQEMVDKLDEITRKYNLNLLSAYIPCEHYEGNVILGALGLDGLIESGKLTDIEYGGGYFFPEGTFNIDMTISMDAGNWKWKNARGSYRYSSKDFFDPVTGGIGVTEEYTQWNYTRKDGQPVLLVLNEETARIYADLPEAFVSIHIDPVTLVNGEKVLLTKSALEQLSELFNLSINPNPVDMDRVESLKAQAIAEYEAKKTALIEERESKSETGYKEFVEYRLETLRYPENVTYLLYDMNGDGSNELVINGYDILSMKNGTSFKYFDITAVNIAGAVFYPCEGNTFELCHELFAIHQYYFYRAEKDRASFITGLIHDTTEDIWYRSLYGGAYNENREQITAEEAQQIRSSYSRIEANMLPLTKYGQDVVSVNYTDPYAQYIADKLDRYENATNYEYALLDVNGDGIKELISRDEETHFMGETYYLLSIHSIKDGKLWDMGMDRFTYVCEGGILEDSEDYAGQGNDRAYHYFYRCTPNGVEPIEKVVRDPITLYWGHALAGQDGKTVTEEAAKSILTSYKRLELDWKSFEEYPFS